MEVPRTFKHPNYMSIVFNIEDVRRILGDHIPDDFLKYCEDGITPQEIEKYEISLQSLRKVIDYANIESFENYGDIDDGKGNTYFDYYRIVTKDGAVFSGYCSMEALPHQVTDNGLPTPLGSNDNLTLMYNLFSGSELLGSVEMPTKSFLPDELDVKMFEEEPMCMLCFSSILIFINHIKPENDE